MLVKDLFEKDISRHLNGVVKAEQQDQASVWQELDEFVVTQELDQHLRRFFGNYSDALDRGGDPDVAGNIGVWISGFFGSGKSHFIKVLSYLLRNEVHTFQGREREAIAFFESKVTDPILLGDIKRAASSSTDVVLFNIDSKADRSAHKDALLHVFLSVLNDIAGYSRDYPSVAHMERLLDKQGVLEAFHAAYLDQAGIDWTEGRNFWMFNRIHVIEAVSAATGQSTLNLEPWLNDVEKHLPLTIENFCKWVRDFIDGKGPSHRVVFLVDEVGQFIGADTQLMLSLQTITEELGTVCEGRAWIVVTSQEDIDSVLGDIEGSKANDFSKIQGRFRTRLTLSSANVDEVIQKRLLAKKPDVRSVLESEYRKKRDILNNQLSFRNAGMTLQQYRHTSDFVRTYPVAPFQFKLLQKIFEAIRKAGATGLHLAQGERSLLDAFQQAIMSVAEREIGVLIPLFRFYPAIENFLDTAVKRTIEYSTQDPALKPFDTELLQVLFLIRYVDEIKGSVDNLTTLCMDAMDAPRVELRRKVESALARLEGQTLVSRSVDEYCYLTSEEQAINREIRRIPLVNSTMVRSLGQLIFEDVLDDLKKHRFKLNKEDYPFKRVSDGHTFKVHKDHPLTVSVITPLSEDYEAYLDQARCVFESDSPRQVIVRLQDQDGFQVELEQYLRTKQFLHNKDDGTLSQATQQIHRDLADQNFRRRKRLDLQLRDAVAGADYFAAGSQITVHSHGPRRALGQALEYLIRETYTKMVYLDCYHENPRSEVSTLLQQFANRQSGLLLDADDSNQRALEDLNQFLWLSSEEDRRVLLSDLVESRRQPPYGWPEWETILVLAKLVATSKIHLLEAGAAIAKKRVLDAITRRSRWKSIVVKPRKAVAPDLVRRASRLGRELFHELGPETADQLQPFLRRHLDSWFSDLSRVEELQRVGKYPGREATSDALTVLKHIRVELGASAFFERMLEFGPELVQAKQATTDLLHFQEQQRALWDRLCAALQEFGQNELELREHERARSSLQRLKEIHDAKEPWSMIKEVDGLIRDIRQVNEGLIEERRDVTRRKIEAKREEVSRELEIAGADTQTASGCLAPLEYLALCVDSLTSVAHIDQLEVHAEKHRTAAFGQIAEFSKSHFDGPKPKPLKVVRPAALVRSGFLETQGDVDEFLRLLRRILLDVIERDERAEIA